VRIEAEYIDTFPFVGNVAFTMLERPTIDFEVKPFHLGDIMPIPGVTPLAYDIIHMIVIDQMFLFPNKFLYDVSFLGKKPPALNESQKKLEYRIFDGIEG